jgi:hypothetical protein
MCVFAEEAAGPITPIDVQSVESLWFADRFGDRALAENLIRLGPGSVPGILVWVAGVGVLS